MHQIGVGVLGPVFRTYDPAGHRLVALKAFHLDITPEQAAALAVALQGVVQAAPSHPSIVRPVGAGLSDGVPYLALEHVAAESLDVAIRHYAPAAVDTALPFVAQMAEALDAAHARGLSHGALHLRDIFVMPELARVSGFGVVSALERVGLRGPLRRPYTAPEQIAGADWGPASDRFALAAIAYELLTGKRAAGTGGHATDHLAGVPGVSDATRVARVFAAALADDPDARPASARLLADQLADAVAWTGAEAVRQALVGLDGDAGEPTHEVSDQSPVIAAAGVSERPDARAETTGTGAVLATANTNEPGSAPEDAWDWTERRLDRGEPDELRTTAPYQPRLVGASREVETRPYQERGAVPDGDRIDATDDDIVADGYDAPAPVETRRPSVEPRLPAPRAASLLDQLEPEPDAPEPDDQPDDQYDDRYDDDDDAVDLSVIQARYRPADAGSKTSGDFTDPQAAGVDGAVAPSDLPSRPGRAHRPARDENEDVATYGYEDQPVSPDSPDDDTERHDDLSFLSVADGEGGYDADDDLSFLTAADGEDEYGRDDGLQGGVVASDRAGRSRGWPLVPVTLIALVIAVGAFAVGFGWVGRIGRVTTGAPAPSETVVAGGLADAGEVREPSPSPQASSDVLAAEAPPDRAPAEPASAPPIVAAVPSEPERAASARPARPDTNDETGAPAPPAIAPIARAPAPTSGRLLVRSIPPGVGVVVNGEQRGITPLALGDLPYGAYDVRLTLEGYEPQERRLAISPDDPIAAISAELAIVAETRTAPLGVGSIYVDTRPRGVEVWLDQRLVGKTPMLIPQVPTGAHEVEFTLEGYRAWATTVEVGPSAPARVTASLDHAGR